MSFFIKPHSFFYKFPMYDLVGHMYCAWKKRNDTFQRDRQALDSISMGRMTPLKHMWMYPTYC